MISAGPAGPWPELKRWAASVNGAQTKRELSQWNVSEDRS